MPNRFTTAEAAQQLNVSERRVRALVKNLKSEVERVGGAILLSRAQINSMKYRKPGRPRKNPKTEP